MKHVERKDGKVVGVYENAQFHANGKPRTEAVADSHAEAAKFLAEREARSMEAVRKRVQTRPGK